MTETGDELVSLVCEASKNLLKYHPLLVLPDKEKETSHKSGPSRINLENGRSNRSLSFHDIPTHDPRHDINHVKRPSSRSGSFPGTDRDIREYKDVYNKRKGPGNFPKNRPGQPHYVQDSSNYDKECFLMYNADQINGYWEHPPQSQSTEDMQAKLSSQQAYYPVQNQYQSSPYYDTRFQQHIMTPGPLPLVPIDLDIRSSPLGPVPIPLSPSGMQV
jgi:hypothetical protein